MTIGELLTLIGIAASTLATFSAIHFAAFRSMSTRFDRAVEQIVKRIDRDFAKMETAIKEGDDQLHERVNRLREDVAKNYVRRDDLDGHLTRMAEQLKEVREDLKQVIRQTAARVRPKPGS